MKGQRLFPDMANLVRQASYQHAGREAFVTKLPNGLEGSLLFSEVDEFSAAFAAYLLKSVGLKKGERVAIHLPNCLAYPVCALGVLRSGLVLVNINPQYSERQVLEVLRDSGARVLITLDFHAQKFERVLSLTAVRMLVFAGVAEFFPFWSRAFSAIAFNMRGSKKPKDKRVCSLQSALEFGMDHEHWELGSHITPSPYDIAMFQYTGGTTGAAKAVMLTHGNIAVNVSQIVNIFERRVESLTDEVLTSLSFSNSFAFMINLLAFYWMGAKNVVLPFSRPLVNLRSVLRERKITWMIGAPNFYKSLLSEHWFTKSPPLTVKAAISVGMNLQRELAEDFAYVTGAPLVEGYGLTEACSIVTLNPLFGGGVFSNSVGHPLMDTELGVFDCNAKSTSAGCVGELIVRGPQVMAGYWNRSEATSRALRDGWLFTGDLAEFRDDGTYRVIGRKTHPDQVRAGEQECSRTTRSRDVSCSDFEFIL